MNKAYNADCMTALKEFPDNYFDLAVVDPPYGINITGRHRSQSLNVERERERAGPESEAPSHLVARTRVYGESKKALSTQNFIPCLMTAPHQTRRLSGSWNVSAKS